MNNNTVTIGYKTFTFPTWEGYSNLTELKNLVQRCCFGDTENIIEYAAKMYLERQYFYDMLLFFQAKLDRQIFNDEPLGLCLDSSKELFDIMITPCEIIKKCPHCKSELVVNEDNKSELECPNFQCIYISSAGKIYREMNTTN